MRWWLITVRHGSVAVAFRVRAVSSDQAVGMVARWSHADRYTIVSVLDEGLVAA